MVGLNSQLFNLVVVLAMIPLSKRIDFSDPTILTGCRVAYITSNVIIALLYLYVQRSINQKRDTSTLEYVEPAPVGSAEGEKVVTTTVQAYDSAQLRNLFRTQLMGIAMMAAMHLYMKYTNPLVVQSIIPLNSALESTLVKIHVWGRPATDDLKRPFKQAAGLMGLLQGGQPQTDKKAIETTREGRGKKR